MINYYALWKAQTFLNTSFTQPGPLNEAAVSIWTYTLSGSSGLKSYSGCQSLSKKVLEDCPLEWVKSDRPIFSVSLSCKTPVIKSHNLGSTGIFVKKKKALLTFHGPFVRRPDVGVDHGCLSGEGTVGRREIVRCVKVPSPHEPASHVLFKINQ